ncbi:hypothetical protein ACHAPC_006451 [Botrytis cinerea]
MSRKNTHVPIFEVAFANCYISDDRPRSANKLVPSRSIPYLSFGDDLYQESGPQNEPKISSNFKAVKPIGNFLRDGPTSLDFWKLFKMLPVGVRNRIYKLLIFAWSPDAQFARLSRNGRRFSISRRVSEVQRALPPIHYLSDDVLGLTEDDLEDWTNEKHWDQSEGMLDFFKPNEYQSIQKLIWLLEKVEYALQLDEPSSNNPTTGEKGNGKEIQKMDVVYDGYINLWKEIVDFFWDNVVIDFGERLNFGTIVLNESKKQKIVQIRRCTTKDNHAEVKHICLHVDNIWHYQEHTVDEQFSDHCELCRFLLLCKFITEHFQCVKTLLLYLSLTKDDLIYFHKNTRDVALDVVKAIKGLQISDEFDVRVRVLNPRNGRASDKELDYLSNKARQIFLKCLEPHTITNTKKAN